MRLPVSRLRMWRRIRLDVPVPGYIATEHETSESLRYPFQMGRGAMMRLAALDATWDEMERHRIAFGSHDQRRINGLAELMARARLSLICALSSLWCKAR